MTLTGFAAPDATDGVLFERFVPRRVLGEGSSGRVLGVFDRVFRAEVALKELTRMGPSALLHFKSEFRVLSDVHHPNLVRLYELLERDGEWAFSMELLEGSDFRNWVRVGRGFDELRLRDALLQLGAGLSALHARGIVHRDVKPSNVRVTREGRVVLLDFGLATQAGDADGTGHGTVEYMAPEQADSSVGPAADFYALGVMLYEALTGELPFRGNWLEIGLQKQHPPAESPRARVRLVPPELDALCMALLDPNPATRAGAERLFAQLGEQRTGARMSLSPAAGRDLFVGRHDELTRALASYRRARREGLRLLLIEGESGIGKTTLARELTQRIAANEPALLALSGRCHAAEQLPFKLFDGVIDELAKELAAQPREAARALVSEHSARLAQLFPVLRQVDAIREQRSEGESDELERVWAFRALAQLLCRLSERRPLLLRVDDLQWADEESLSLLSALLEATPAPRALLVMTMREASSFDAKLAEKVRELMAHARVDVLPLSPLDQEQAALLSARSLGVDVDDTFALRIARAARGHPFFIAELAAARDASVPESLDAALTTRFASLPELSRRVLELLAVSSAPLPSAVICSCLGAPFDELSEALQELRAMSWVRAVRRSDLTCYHDRIREAVLDTLDAARSRAMHRQLALAFQGRDDADPAELARHFLAADLSERALPWLRLAAERALAQRAFERAAALYRAILSHGAGLLDAQSLGAARLSLSSALGSAGLNAEAARVLLQDLERARPEERTEREGHAARLLLRAGEVKEGAEAARRALLAVDMSWPGSQAGALTRLILQRADLTLRGFTPGTADERSASRMTAQLDALWGLWQPMSWADLLRGAELGARHLRLALKRGDPRHMSLGLCSEALLESMQDPRSDRPARLLARAQSLLASDASSELTAYHDFATGTVALFCNQLEKAQLMLERAEARLVRDCPGEAWQLVNVRGALLNAHINRGHFALVARRAEEWIVAARTRRDQFALTTYVAAGYGMARHLLRGDADTALAELTEVMAPWPRQHFGLQHFGAVSAGHVVHAYRAGAASYQHWQEAWPVVSRSFLFRAQSVRDVLLAMRCEATLRAALGSQGITRAKLLDETSDRLAPLAQSHSLLGQACHHYLGAQLALAHGKRDVALSGARAARAAFVEMGNMSEQFCDLMIAQLEDTSDKREVSQRVSQWLRGEGWHAPERAIQTWLPACVLF